MVKDFFFCCSHSDLTEGGDTAGSLARYERGEDGEDGDGRKGRAGGGGGGKTGGGRNILGAGRLAGTGAAGGRDG